MAKKIKVFCAAYINKTNAQNLSILSMAKAIDKEKFEIYTCTIFNGDLPIPKIEGVKLFHCFYPFKISGILAFIWGIWHCDIAYFPRAEFSDWGIFLVKLFGKKSFKTVRNKLDDAALEGPVSIYTSRRKMIRAYTKHNRVYSTTSHMRDYNFHRFGIKTEPQTLFVTSDTTEFYQPGKQVTHLQNIIFIGNDMKRKGMPDYLYVAGQFPLLTFHVVGKATDSQRKELERCPNVKYHGILPQPKMKELFKIVDLHIFPSRSEGLGKVTIETASSGIPTITYADYGPDEWIKHGEEGFVVKEKEEIAAIVGDLIENPAMLQQLSRNAYNLAARFDIGLLTRIYEKIMEDLYHADR
jgi:glycosyltransferase involved in cell wall biosynthesis